MTDLPIYKIVNGERQLISERDPKRRYSRVADCSTGEQYDLEFTDQQERERDAEEAKWEAEAPMREAQALERERKTQEFRDSLVYEDRIVAFLDVLGWKGAILNSVDNPELPQNLIPSATIG